jgi:hypothetical protein
MSRSGRVVAGIALATTALVGVSAASVGHHTPVPRFRIQPLPMVVSARPSAVPLGGAYDPSQIQAAYDLAPLFKKGTDGKGQTIVIVDAYGSPTIKADLATFDNQFHLAAPPSFRIITPAGAIPPYSASGTDRVGWATETSLDVEWSHVMAPKASILLVETPTDEVEGTSGFPDIVRAENYVVAHKLGNVISQSFAATEVTFTSLAQITPLRSAYIAAEKAGVTVLAGSGDWGSTGPNLDGVTYSPTASTNWPASDPLVTGVGGLTVRLNSAGKRNTPDSAWNDTYQNRTPSPEATGGGLSSFFARPGYQDGVQGVVAGDRGVPDVSMDANPDFEAGGVNVYMSFASPGNPGWHDIGGTSLATPLFAGVVALADQVAGHGLGLLNPALYGLDGQSQSGIVDITSGNNTVAFENAEDQLVTVPGYTAGRGYDLATGVGSINGAVFVPALEKFASTLVGVTTGSKYHFGGSAGIATTKGELWVANVHSVTEVHAPTGAFARGIAIAGDVTGIASDGTHVWVTSTADQVTELLASTGAVVQTISGPSYGFDAPDGISSDGKDVWVADGGNSSVTEFTAATGALVQVLTPGSYGLDDPTAITSNGVSVWVANGNNSVTELQASTGQGEAQLSGPSYGFDQPSAITNDGTSVWVVNEAGNSVTQLSESGALVGVVSGSTYGFDSPRSVYSDGIRVWVANHSGNSVSEFDASSGALLEVLKGSRYGFSTPTGIALSGTQLWVSNGASISRFPAI